MKCEETQKASKANNYPNICATVRVVNMHKCKVERYWMLNDGPWLVSTLVDCGNENHLQIHESE